MATIKQVSELAEVSSATVSRVINNPDSVKGPTRAKVLEAINTLGYRHNVIAASLASNKTHTVGYVVPELHGFFFGSMMSGTEAVLRAANKHMFVATGHSDETMEREAIDDLRGRRCDALILHVEALSEDYLLDLAKQNVPFVIVNRYIDAISERCIALDNTYGGYLATKTLLDMGHRDIAYIAGSLWKSDGRDRLNGHIKALQEGGLMYDPRLMHEGNFKMQAGQQGVDKFLNGKLGFSAVVCGNDEMAAGALGALRERGISVPEDISVMGFDDVEFAPLLYPSLTTVKYPTQAIGEMAARWILNQVYNQNYAEPEHMLRPHLVSRASCASR